MQRARLLNRLTSSYNAALGIAALAATEAVQTWRAGSLADTCCR